MAAVTPQAILCELGSYYPAGSVVKPPPRQAAGTLAASERQRRRESSTEKKVHLENVVGVCRRKKC